jgi:hypothetical protein
VGPRAALDDVEKGILDHTGTQTPTPFVKLVASRYTDCAIPAPKTKQMRNIYLHIIFRKFVLFPYSGKILRILWAR